MANKFKVGDIVRIKKFPMGMIAGDNEKIERWFLAGQKFTITEKKLGGSAIHGFTYIPAWLVETPDKSNWYFDEDSIDFCGRGV